MKPTIGVTPLWDDEKSSLWMLPGYLDVIREAGGIPIIFPLNIVQEDLIQLCELCDGFILTGGHDVSPALYGQQPSAECGAANHLRDSLESVIFDFATTRDLPLLGICRGIQIVNVLCGGSLYQDLPSEHKHPKRANHQMTPPYDKPCHRVNIIENTPLAELIRERVIEVNSYHHQAIKALSPQLRAMAISEDDLVEAVYMEGKHFVQALQWHPEFNHHCDENSRKIVAAFINAARNA